MSNKKKREKLISKINLLRLQFDCLAKEVDFYCDLTLNFCHSDNLIQLIDLKLSLMHEVNMQLAGLESVLFDLDFDSDLP